MISKIRKLTFGQIFLLAVSGMFFAASLGMLIAKIWIPIEWPMIFITFGVSVLYDICYIVSYGLKPLRDLINE